MKVIENAKELLQAFENLPVAEQQTFFKALNVLVGKRITYRDTSLNPADFFGIWQGDNINADDLRKEAWGNRA